jgi:surface antigen
MGNTKLSEKRTMKRYGYLLMVAVLGISTSGCTSPSGRPDYTASGALAGGATGAIIGSTARQPGPAPLVGAAMGAVVGGLIGHEMDQDQEAQLRAQAQQTLQRVEQSQPLTVADVKSLVKAGISDDLVISQIRNSRTVYHLNTADIVDLKNSGVSEKIIDFMINTPTQVQSAQVAGVVGTVPPPPLAEQVVVVPGPDYVWVGGAWVWFGDRWVWHHGYWHRPLHPYEYGHHGR